MGRILDIPNLRQLKNHCGPATLSMYARHLGFDYSQKKFARYWGQEEVRREGVEFDILPDLKVWDSLDGKTLV